MAKLIVIATSLSFEICTFYSLSWTNCMCVYVCMYVCMCMCVCMCVYVCMYVCVYVCVYVIVINQN